MYEDFNKEEHRLKANSPKHYILVTACVIGLFYTGFSTGVLSTTHTFQSKLEYKTTIMEEVDVLVDEKLEAQTNELKAGITKEINDILSTATTAAVAVQDPVVEENEVQKTQSHYTEKNDLPDMDESDLDVVSVTDEEYELILKCVQCESGYWTPEWKKYTKKDFKNSQKAVTNCILNLATYKNKSISEVIMDHSTFNVWPTAMANCGVIDDGVIQAVNEVLAGDRDYKVTCFRTKHYHGTGWSTPMYYYAGSYFSYINDYVNNMEVKEDDGKAN